MMSEQAPTLTAIYSSPRRGGNSDVLLDAALDGAESAGATVSRFYLREMTFRPCQNCGYCSKTGVCRFADDDMGPIYDALDNSDIILLASPIYFCSVCAQAKAMIDRCQPYWARKYELKTFQPKPGRRGGFICCGGFPDDRFLKCTEQIIKTWYYIMDIKYRGVAFEPKLDARGDAAKSDGALERAAEFGRGIVGA
jgi:multimeric flavodoxin WrbA